MTDQTADLGEYIAKYHSVFSRKTTSKGQCRIFGMENRPLLKKGQKNRVLLYAGCFNPPHLGHYSILRRAFEASQDINAIAAIVLPVDDDRVQGKCKKIGQSLVLPKSERVRLWRSDAKILPEWWIYDGSTEEWKWLWKDLKVAIKMDGFDLRFTNVLGPDHISRFGSYSGLNWGCYETITSDAGRQSDLVKANGSLFTLPGGFTP
ncbi:uncharacterized protein ColSpa_01231 [Colletotrichum spaethianum]|uniref:Cytidyltransferase-like domain-containing protein n=1 Tax=Colletotrichum spaethianum TaxID=700344 RepID=A0AA37L7V0_9PEZI|nr:uncharacterized protein ColSpa_01231 [Colletotrichum spaethianum]GKT41050.1 hypothetical protein ColSpa_01231 [Colletotrichum spaethianum]